MAELSAKPPRVVTFPPSMDCEVGRWALHRYGVAFEEEPHAPPFFLLAVRLRGGRKFPLYLTEEMLINGARPIVDYFELMADPDHRLVPKEHEEEIDAAWTAYNGALGRAVVTWAYTQLLPHPSIMVRPLSLNSPWYQQLSVRHFYGLSKRFLWSSLKLGSEAATKALTVIREVFGEVERRLSGSRRYLIGDRFTLADMAFAVAGAPMVLPQGYGGNPQVQGPIPTFDELPPEAKAVVVEMRDRPAGRFILRLYEQERYRQRPLGTRRARPGSTVRSETASGQARSVAEADLRIACRMIRSCAVAYGIGEPGGIEASPYYGELGFETVPAVFQSGEDAIDACFVGTTPTEAVLAFRGTLPLAFSSASAFIKSLLDWHEDAELAEEGVHGIPGRVHRGFAESLAALWGLFLPELKRQLASGRSLVVTGHSKGAALATLAAVKLLKVEGLRARNVFPFASPRTGDPSFAKAYDAALPQTWRFANRDDIVPHLPPSEAFVEVLEMLPGGELKELRRLPAYEHVQSLRFIDWEGRIEGDSVSLELKRLAHMAKMLEELKLKGIADDHSSTGGYLVDTCKPAASQ